MKKKITALLLALMLLLSACGLPGGGGSFGGRLDEIFDSGDDGKTQPGTDAAAAPDGGNACSVEPEGQSEPEQPTEPEQPAEPAHKGAPRILIITHYESRYDYDLYVNFGYSSVPLIFCGDQIAVGGGYEECLTVRDDEAYPELARALRERNETTLQAIGVTLDSIEDYAREDYSYGSYEGAKDPQMIYSTVTTAWLSRADSDIVSIRCENFSYSGGAHPYTSYYGLNYDSETGRELHIGDLLSDEGRERLPQVFETEMDRTAPDFRLALLVDSVSEEIRREIDEDALRFVVDCSGVTILISQYELAAYAAGPLFVKIRFDEYPELFNDKYVFKGGDWVTELRPQCRNYDSYGYEELDFDTPYGSRHLAVTTRTGSYYGDSDSGITVELDGSAWRTGEDFFSYDVRAYLICSGGMYYLYLEHYMPNDWPALYVLDLNGGEPVLIGELYEGPGAYPLTDPDCFFLSTRSYVMSTYNVVRRYTMADSGPDKGLPQPIDELYYATTAPVLTLRRDFVFTELLPDGGEREVSLAAGEQLRFYRTDMESLVDLVDSSGRVLRVSYDPGEAYMGTVEGVPLEELFDGTMFAG